MNSISHHLPACLLDRRILALTPGLLLWQMPAASHSLHIASVKGETVTLLAPWPSLLLCLVASPAGRPEMHLAAIRRQGRPSERTPLYHAPLMNIDEQGLFLGDLASPSNNIDPRQLQHWEEALLGFSFSVVGHDKTLRPADMAAGASINGYHHARAWRELSRSKVDRFPGQLLVSRKQTLGQWLVELEEASQKAEAIKRAARPGPAALKLVQDSSVVRGDTIALG